MAKTAIAPIWSLLRLAEPLPYIRKKACSSKQDIAVGTLGDLIMITEIAKADSDKDQRYHYVAFPIESKDGTDVGRHKFGLKASVQPAPTANELKDGDGIYRMVNSVAKPAILAYTLDSGIGDYVSDANNIGKLFIHGVEGANVDDHLLTPNTDYALYVMVDNGNNVDKVTEFSTDNVDN